MVKHSFDASHHYKTIDLSSKNIDMKKRFFAVDFVSFRKMMQHQPNIFVAWDSLVIVSQGVISEKGETV